MNVQAASRNTPLREALAASPRSRLDLASAVGVDPVTVWRWETGKSIPTSEPMRRAIAQALGRDISDVFPSSEEST